MTKMLLLVAAISIALVLGCGKETEDEVAGKRAEQETGSAEKVDISDEPGAVKAPDVESGTEPAEKAIEPKQEKDIKKAASKPVDVSDDSFESEVLKSDIPVLVDFWAPWCRPCRVAAPVLESIAQQYKGKLKVCKLNVDQARQTAMKYGIRSIPTLIFYKNGKPVDQVVGVLPDYEAQLKKKIESHL